LLCRPLVDGCTFSVRAVGNRRAFDPASNVVEVFGLPAQSEPKLSCEFLFYKAFASFDQQLPAVVVGELRYQDCIEALAQRRPGIGEHLRDAARQDSRHIGRWCHGRRIATQTFDRALDELEMAELFFLDVQELGRENPLAIGALALAAGVGVGLLLPSTQREDELLGSARDRMVGQVTGSVEGLKRTAKGTAHDVSDAFREVTRG
jgi:hypothetical protein